MLRCTRATSAARRRPHRSPRRCAARWLVNRPRRRLIRLGTAGWSLPRIVQPRFTGDGTHLSRYARVFTAAEINSSFHRPHRRGTYERWAASVPADFRFSVKLPKAITHVCMLIDAEALLDAFLAESSGLGASLGCLLVQLAPKHALDEAVAARFFAALRERHSGDVVLEPRHASWFTAAAAQLCERYRVARVAADPARVREAARPGGSPDVAYWRWHGTPHMYRSSYDDATLRDLARDLLAAEARGQCVWCIFDNTASGAAAANALTLRAMLGSTA